VAAVGCSQGGGTAMGLGRRKREWQEPLFVTAAELPNAAGAPFYRQPHALLAEADFDRWNSH